MKVGAENVECYHLDSLENSPVVIGLIARGLLRSPDLTECDRRVPPTIEMLDNQFVHCVGPIRNLGCPDPDSGTVLK